ncbi:ferredoxin--NADP reductase [Hyphomicrobium sp.]|uniref:ferredoxin--NADP reductase n=1 Tax=Hyphomicrobium sp. TaxID=82 RepID=UPI002E2F8534|nr:ferredoxin--NADP reductase [Hyphomicrobium sp.]HEX2842560.1 ferredoxin--NADP reductase [Hyphomicrobium sp.]
MGSFFSEHVLEVTHHTDKLFSFKTTRSPSFRFQSGQFTMIGVEAEGRPLLRAYSVASAFYDDWLEFFSIKVPGGPLTSRLQHIRKGDIILVGPKPTGTLLNGHLRPGRRLFLLATGTGFAPFASLLRDPETYERFETVIAVEGCRTVAELGFADRVVAEVKNHELLGELAMAQLHYYSAVTQEPFVRQGRIPGLITSGTLFQDLEFPALDREGDRVMICGNPGMLAELTALLTGLGFVEGSSGEPGDFVIEKAFAQR